MGTGSHSVVTSHFNSYCYYCNRTMTTPGGGGVIIKGTPDEDDAETE